MAQTLVTTGITKHEKMTCHCQEDVSTSNSLGLMFNDSSLSDIQLKFDREEKMIFAHKLILSLRSKVFHQMFFGELATTEAFISIESYSFEVMLEVVRFVYKNYIKCNLKTCFDIMNAAHFYDIGALENFCSDIILTNLNIGNVCQIYEICYLLNNKLTQNCLSMVDECISEIVHTKSFLNIDKAPLLSILARETLRIQEGELYIAVYKWSELACERMSLKVSVENRRILLDNLKSIRFHCMSKDEFGQCYETDPNMFTPDEFMDISKYLFSSGMLQPTTMTFSAHRRVGEMLTNQSEQEIECDENYQTLELSDSEHVTYLQVTKYTQILQLKFVRHENYGVEECANLIAVLKLSNENRVLCETSDYNNEQAVFHLNRLILVPGIRYCLKTSMFCDCQTYQFCTLPLSMIFTFEASASEPFKLTFIHNIIFKSL